MRNYKNHFDHKHKSNCCAIESKGIDKKENLNTDDLENVIQGLKDRLILDISAHLSETDAAKIRNVITDSLEKLGQIFGANRVILFSTKPDKDIFSASLEWHDTQSAPLASILKELKFSQYPLLEKFAVQRRIFQISNIANIPDIYSHCKELLTNLGSKAFLQSPLLFGEELTGFLIVSSSKENVSWEKEDINFLVNICRLIQTLLKNQEITNHYVKQAKSQSNIISGSMHNNILESLEFGIAIFDPNAGDFIFSNSKCMQLLGLKEADQLNKKTVFRYFSENGYRPSDFFYRENFNLSQDFSVFINQKYLSGAVIPVAGTSWLTMNLYDITPIVNFEKNEKTLSNQLKTLSEAAIKLLSINDEDIYKFIGETAYSLVTENALVVVKSYNKEQGYLKPKVIKGKDFPSDKITKLIGKHPLHKKYPLDKNSHFYHEYTSSRLREIKGGINELSLGTISVPVSQKLEEILGTGKYYGCGLFADGNLYGTMSFLLPADSFLHPYIFETFSQLASKALHGIKMGAKLQDTKSALWNAAAIARLGYWKYDICSRKLIIDKSILKDFNTTESDEKIIIPIDRFLQRYASPDQQKMIKEKLDLASQNIRNVNFTLDMEWEFIRKDKTPLHLYTRGVVQADGKIMGIAQDISNIREAEKSLKESEVKFRNLIKQSLDPIIVIQDDGHITEWNASCEKLSGISAEEAIGRYIWDIESEITFKPSEKEEFTEYPKNKFREHFFRFFDKDESKKPVARDISMKANDGELKYLTVTSFVFNDNNRKYLCRIFKDITLEKEKQEREKQEEIRNRANKAKELFLDNMSHEMRTPLSGIIGMTDILMRSGLTSRQAELMKVVKESSDSLLELISNIHQLSAIEAHGIVIRKEPFTLSSLIDKTLGIFRAAALQKEINLIPDYEEIRNIRLLGDEFRLQQILTNLLANAIKFTASGGSVTVSAMANHKSGDATELKISIKDTGIGISKEKIPILFDKFTQADSSYTREHEGAGIGLAISKELIELMGGTIGVSSEYMRGADFWIRLTLPNAS